MRFNDNHKDNIWVKLNDLFEANRTLLFCQQFTVQLFDDIACQ